MTRSDETAWNQPRHGWTPSFRPRKLPWGCNSRPGSSGWGQRYVAIFFSVKLIRTIGNLGALQDSGIRHGWGQLGRCQSGPSWQLLVLGRLLGLDHFKSQMVRESSVIIWSFNFFHDFCSGQLWCQTRATKSIGLARIIRVSSVSGFGGSASGPKLLSMIAYLATKTANYFLLTRRLTASSGSPCWRRLMQSKKIFKSLLFWSLSQIFA